MSRHSSTPGFIGLAAIAVSVVAVSFLITLVTGEVRHLPLVALGLLVGSWAVASINKNQ